MVKLLVAGDVSGDFASLWQTASKVHTSKNGPFDALICVGNFFGGDAKPESLLPYLTGEKAVPLPTFFITGGEPSLEGAAALLDEIGDGGSLAPNLTFLGRSGVKSLPGNIRVAYLSGRFNANNFRQSLPSHKYRPNYSHEDVRALFNAYKEESARGVDLLLTAEWPKGFQILLQPESFADVPHAHMVGSLPARDVASQIAARYHFCGVEDIYYLRPAYKTESSFCRTIALAQLGSKAKSLYACNLSPVVDLQVQDLTKYPPGTTESPFVLKEQGQKVVLEAEEQVLKRHKPAPAFAQVQPVKHQGPAAAAGFNRWGLTEGTIASGRVPGPAYVCKICGEKGHFVGDCPQRKPRQGEKGEGGKGAGDLNRSNVNQECWFCLGSSKVETHLVVSIASHSYLATDKGPITPEHVLILPQEHEPSFAHLTSAARAEVEKYKTALRAMYDKVEKAPIFWERNIAIRGQNHMQVQAVGLPAAVAAGAKRFIINKAEELQIEFQIMQEDQSLTELGSLDYVYIEISSKVRLLHRVSGTNKVKGLFNFARECVAALLGQPERGDWKKCTLDKEKETAYASNMKSAFEPFNFAKDSDSDSDSD